VEPSRETLVLLEEVAANAVPPTTVQLVDGWLLRAWPEAPFRRPNSVLAVRGDAHGLAARLGVVEDFYRRRGLPVRYQVGAVVEPPGLEEQLAARGYVIEAATVVQTATVADVIAASAPVAGVQVDALDAADEHWLAQHGAAHGDDPAPRLRVATYAGLLARVAPRAIAAAARASDGATLAAGFVVVERGWGGIFGMGTRPEARRTGVARTLLHALARHAETLGATRLYLQVEAGNTPALALYARSGFDRAYDYHYRSLGLPVR
jgi:ribosomal protein S18 acetylase RimI-like enzyme